MPRAFVLSCLTLVLGLGLAFGLPTLAYAEAEVALSGAWQKKNYTTRGGWRIVKEEGSTFLELTDDFETKRAPDLKIFLSPANAGDLNSGNATRGAILVAKLKSSRGAARFAVPASVDLDKYKSVALHCQKYSALFAASPLR